MAVCDHNRLKNEDTNFLILLKPDLKLSSNEM